MASTVIMRWDRSGLRYAEHVRKNYGAKAVKDVVMRRLTAIAGSVQGIARGLARRRLKVRSGRLGRKIEARARALPKTFRLEVGVFSGKAARYAGIQEYGTRGIDPKSPYPTIRPKRAKALAMPVNSAVDSRGVARFVSPRTDPVELTFIPASKSANTNVVGLLVSRKELRAWRRDGKPGLPPARWILLKQVDLEPRRFLRDAMEKVQPRVIADLQTALGQFLVRGGRFRR